MPTPQTPDWVRDAIFYQIYPDRFARSLSLAKPSGLDAWGSAPTPHGYQGGDLVGVVERLDYLADLGVNAIYFTPIFQSASNHRYHTHDYYRVDPMLGGNAALKRLIDEAHGRGMKVVLDGVFNHASRGFFQFHDILENGQNSAYLDWFTVHGWPLNAYDHEPAAPGYSAWWGLHALPKFNTETKAVREFLWDVGKLLDRLRCRRLAARRRARDRRPFVLGRVPQERSSRQPRRLHCRRGLGGRRLRPPHRLRRSDRPDRRGHPLAPRRLLGRGHELPVHPVCYAFFIGDNVDVGEMARRPASAPSTRPAPRPSAATSRSSWRTTTRTAPAVMMNLLGSHDIARFVHFARGDTSALRLATLFQMTFPGAPSIYYGDEIGLAGGHDPDNRRAFPWYDKHAWDHDLLHEIQRLIRLRNQYPSLRRGTFDFLHAAGEVAAYVRKLDGEAVVVVINAGKHTHQVDIPTLGQLPDGTTLVEAWTHKPIHVEGGQIAGLDLAPRSGRVFVLEATER